MNVKKIVGAFLGTAFRLAVMVAVLYMIYELAIGAYNFGYRVFADIPLAFSPGTDIQVTITESMDDKEIAQNFQEVGLVEDWKLFWVQIQFSEYKETIQPGAYTLNNSMKAEEMLQIIGMNPEETEEE
ncbi:MAG: endolytic transglycosylase MltG [Lachnospiraceae bacterium]|nr:endolytic transglycosylase MltG [Lachnospiraceae bacterium]